MTGRQGLAEWFRFILSEGHVLSRHPQLLFQQAANRPSASPTAAAAADRWSRGIESRSWIQWVNKPRTESLCLMTLAGHRGGVAACAYSPDGRHILSGSEDGTLRIWDASTAAELMTIESSSKGITCCVYSPDGRHFAAGSSDLTVRVWDAHTGRLLCATEPFLGHEMNPSVSCAFSPDGRRVVAAASDIGLFEGLKVFDAETGREVATLGRQEGPVKFCLYSHDGQTILSAAGPDVTLWDARTFKRKGRLPGGAGNVTAWTQSPDGTRLFTSASSPSLPWHPSEGTLWDLRKGRRLSSWPEPRGTVHAAEFSPEGRRLILALGFSFFGQSFTQGTLKLVDASSYAEIREWNGHSNTIQSCHFSPDGEAVLTASADGTLRVWNPGAPVSPALPRHRDKVGSCVFAPDGRRLASASASPLAPAQLKMWDGTTGELVAEWEGGADGTTVCAFSPDGQYLISGTHENVLKVWRVSDQTPLLALPFGSDHVNRALYSPDGTRLLCLTGNGDLSLWDPRTGTKLFEFPFKRVSGCLFSPDGSFILVADHESSSSPLHLMNAWTGEVVRRMTTPDHFYVESLAYSADGRRVAAGCAALEMGDREGGPLRCGDLAIWDVATGGEPRLIIEHGVDTVSQCGYSPDGRVVFLRRREGTLQLFDAGTGEPVADLYGRGVNACLWFKDSRRLLLQTGGRALEIWEIESWRCTKRFDVPEDLTSVALAENGEFFAAGDCLGSVYLMRWKGAAGGTP